MAKRAVKPTKLKVLEGNAGHRPLPTNEPEPKSVMPTMPDDLDKDAQEVWTVLGPKLFRLGLLTEADGDAFAILCQIRGRLKQLHAMARGEEGPILMQLRVTVDGAGQEHSELKASPIIKEARLHYQLFRQYAAEFGLSPRGRVGLKTIGNDEDDGFGGLLDDA